MNSICLRKSQNSLSDFLPYLILLFWTTEWTFCSVLPYEFIRPGQIETVVFTSANRETESFGQLYLNESFMEVYCQLRYRMNDTTESRHELVKRYGENGMRPWITFTNMTHNTSFEFSDFVLDGSEAYWKSNISKAEITEEVFSFESSGAWKYFVELGRGLNLFESTGTLVIKELEPLLSLQFGDPVQDPITVVSAPSDLIIRNSACSPGVALISPLLDVTETPYSGCYLGVTYSYFSPLSVQWYNLLHISAGGPDEYSVCKLPTFAECSKLLILDIALVKNQMIVVTSHGMVVSQKFTEALESGIDQQLKFYNVSSVYPILDQEMKAGILKRNQVRFHYTPHCHNIFISSHNEDLCLVYNSQDPVFNSSVLLCSTPPFFDWSDQTPNSTTAQHLNVLSIGHDIQREMQVLLVKDIVVGDTLVEVFNITSQTIAVPPFHFDPSDVVSELYFHSYSSSLFAFGSQVWKSFDGGNSFDKVSSLEINDHVTSFAADSHGETYAYTTKSGSVYIGKTGVHRVRAIKKNNDNHLLNYTVRSLVEQDRNVIALHFEVNSGKLDLYHTVYAITADVNIPEVLGSTLMARFLTETKAEFFPLCQSETGRCSSAFTASHVGKVIHSKYGGSAIIAFIKRVLFPNSEYRFDKSVIAEVITPFRELRDEITNYPLNVSWKEFNATLSLISDGDTVPWRSEDIGRTVILPNGLSFLVLEQLSSISVLATAHAPWRWYSEDTYNRTFDGWTLYDYSATNTENSTWWLSEDKCRSVLITNEYTHAKFFHLDSKDSLSLTASVVSRAFPTGKRFVPAEPRIMVGNPRLFNIKSGYTETHLNISLWIHIRQRPFATGSSSLTIFLDGSSLMCRRASDIIAIHSGCPPSKQLKFLYPLIVSDDVFLDLDALDERGVIRNLNIPFNYRPPSVRGVGIPMSANVYNADPSRPQFRDAYVVTRHTYRYKQCRGKGTRSQCGCTRSMRVSSLVKYSDCIDRAYRLLFSERLTPRFLVLRNGHETESLTSPYYIEEINNRKDYEIINPSNISVRAPAATSLIMKEGQNSSIEFQGSGLYHFRAFAVQENYTFCNLSDEFIVYVDETPLPYPAKDIVRACTAMGFFLMLYVLYLWHFHGKHKVLMTELEEKKKK